jgi:MFS family permease
MAEFIARLKQRKLVQWALAYIAFAFALIQVLDVVAQRFGWPDQIEKLLILALVVGFLVALVLTWYHGERGAQKVSGTEIVILALLLAIGGGLLWRYERVLPSGSPDAAQRAALQKGWVADAGRSEGADCERSWP